MQLLRSGLPGLLGPHLDGMAVIRPSGGANAVAGWWPTPEEHIPSGSDRVRVGLISPANKARGSDSHICGGSCCSVASVFLVQVQEATGKPIAPNYKFGSGAVRILELGEHGEHMPICATVDGGCAYFAAGSRGQPHIIDRRDFMIPANRAHGWSVGNDARCAGLGCELMHGGSLSQYAYLLHRTHG